MVTEGGGRSDWCYILFRDDFVRIIRLLDTVWMLNCGVLDFGFLYEIFWLPRVPWQTLCNRMDM